MQPDEITVRGLQATASTARSFREQFALKPMDLVIVLAVVIAVGARVVSHGFETKYGALRRPLRVGIVAWPGYAGGLVANNGVDANKDSDFWRSYQLLVEFKVLNDDADLEKAFERGGDDGGVDVRWSTVDSLALQLPALWGKGLHPVAFMQVDWSRGGDAIVVTKDISRIEDLKGRQVAVSPSASLFLLEYNLFMSSLTPAEREQVARRRTHGSSDACDLFLKHQVDAAVLWEPDVQRALARDGAKVLTSTAKATKLIADVMIAKQEFIAQHRAEITSFAKGWLAADEQAALDPMLAVAALQKEMEWKLNDQKTLELIGKTKLATWKENVEMFGLLGDRGLFDLLFNKASQLWLARHYVAASVPADQALDISVLHDMYNAPSPAPACGPVLLTQQVELPFRSGAATLSPEAGHILDDSLSFLLRTQTEIGVCVQVAASRGKDADRLKSAREDAIIDYMIRRCDCPWNHFVAASTVAPDEARMNKPPQFVLLKVAPGAHE